MTEFDLILISVHSLSLYSYIPYHRLRKEAEPNLNKKDLIQAVASHTEYPKKDIEGIVNGVFNEITNALYYGEEVNISSFGKFIVKTRTTRKVRNPQTGEIMDIPAANVPVFRPAQKLKSAVL